MGFEKEMEDAIISDPRKYIDEKGLNLVARQYHVGKYIFDLLFEDRHGGKLLVELQDGTLDRNHTYKILDYYHEYKHAHPDEFIDLMVIANIIPPERKKRLADLGIAFREIPRSEFIIEGKNGRSIKIEDSIPSQKRDLSISNWVKVPGVRATLRDQPDSVLEKLESEGHVKDMELLREIVTRVCQLGPCKVGDVNPTRALAINAIDPKTPQFFAILTDQHSLHKKDVGPRGFSIQVAFRKSTGVKPSGTNWVCDRFDYIKKGNQVWWRNELRDAALDVNSIVDEVKKARNTFLSE
jgi:hypothetical protein